MTDQASIAIKRMNPPALAVPPGYLQAVEVRSLRTHRSHCEANCGGFHRRKKAA